MNTKLENARRLNAEVKKKEVVSELETNFKEHLKGKQYEFITKIKVDSAFTLNHTQDAFNDKAAYCAVYSGKVRIFKKYEDGHQIEDTITIDSCTAKFKEIEFGGEFIEILNVNLL